MNEENKTNQEEISSDIANILDEIQGDSKTSIEDAKSEQKEKTKDQVAIEDAFKEVNQNKKHNKKSDKQ